LIVSCPVGTGLPAGAGELPGEGAGDNVLPKLTCKDRDWDLDPTTTLYANIAKGFRLGAANRPIPNTAAVQQDLTTLHLSGTPATFQPDSLWNYEVGSKMRLLDNRLSLRTAAYYIDWSNIQQDVILPVSGYDFETNVGNATSYGLEVEVWAKLVHGLTINASGNWTHATFSGDVPALGFSGSTLNVQKGDPIQGSPSYFAQLGAEYRRSISERADGFIRLNTRWTGPSHGTFIRSSQDYFRPSYFDADASAGVSWEKWDLSLFVKNLSGTRRGPARLRKAGGAVSCAGAWRCRERGW